MKKIDIIKFRPNLYLIQNFIFYNVLPTCLGNLLKTLL